MLQTHWSSDARVAFEQVERYLLDEPVRRNMLMTVLDQRLHSTEPPGGHYWWATDADLVVGYACQTPIGNRALVDAASAPTVQALAAAMFETNPDLEVIGAEASTAATFAGIWTEISGRGAEPTEGERLYELDALQPCSADGSARRATADDMAILLEWHRGFCADIGVDPFPDAVDVLGARVSARRLWLWQDREPVAMVGGTKAIAGACRIGHVYTPPERRGRGYGAALTAAVTADLLAEGARHCLLYTQLANATSNGVYRRIGYRPIEERLIYRFL